MSFVKTDMNRILYTNHGLHLNKIGKQLVHYQLVSFLDSTFEQKRSQPIILGSHKILDDNNLICDGKQMLEIQEVNDVICGNQVCGIQDVNNITCDSNQRHEIQEINNLTCDSNQMQETKDVNNTCDSNQRHKIQDFKTTCNSNQIHKLHHDNNLTCDSNQIQTSSRNLNRNRRLPVIRSNDFLWQM